ncbi:midnolin homolog isoform X1 [Colletes gigas]|uniref:midnolin homolog isoform X1 n=1 Tax=Colletes gigas TaxID=935657 RepID=UPI001C9A4025|nr:midnolin homolog isoform X1 [Colletes gigas]
MDGTTGPPSDVTTAMGSENDEGSKVRRDIDDSTASSTAASSTATYSTSQPEYCGQGSIRAGSASPLPTTSSSSSSSLSSSFSSSPPQPGCGCVAATVLEPDEITISITPTTGGQFDLTVDRTDTVENLKKIISKRLKVAKERICLLHRERQLREGTLEENRLQDGSCLTLLPSVETGLLAQRPEQSVMQALESLNDSQVNDFLSGKAPLNLTMRLGDHMMLIQLQLSTVTPASPTANQTTSNTTGLTIGGNSSNGSNLPASHVSTSLQSRRSTVLAARSTTSASTKLQNGTATARTSSLIRSLVSALHAAASCSTSLSTATTTTSPICSSRATTASSVSSTSYSPISPPHTSFCASQSQTPCTGSNHCPLSPNSNSTACQSCLLYHYAYDHRHYIHHAYNHHHHHHHYNHHHHHHHHHSRSKPTTSPNTSQSPPSPSPPRKKLCTAHHHGQQQSANAADTCRSNVADGDSSLQSPISNMAEQNTKAATLDTRALAEASRNLTQKLKQLSSEVLTSRVDLAEENARRRQGAIIESMHHHGKGVYSGTFSGTLNPALQDRHGRPKRDISTIIHILNDLLCTTPAATAGYYRHHHRHSSGRQQSSMSPSSTGTTTTVNSATTSIGCHDSSAPGYSTKELSKENEATKGKMRRLRLVMEQRRAKRKARRQARAAPRTTQWAAVTPDPTANATESQNEPELQPCSPEPVVA